MTQCMNPDCHAMFPAAKALKKPTPQGTLIACSAACAHVVDRIAKAEVTA